MKKYFLYLFLCLFLPFPSVSSGDEYYFALPTGHPFKEATLDTEVEEGVELSFGERVEIIYELNWDDTVWYRARKDGSSFYVPEPYLVRSRMSTISEESGNLLIGYEVVDKKNAIPLFYTPNDLVKIPEHYRADGYEDRDLLLRREAARAFTLMIDEAENEGVSIRILSAFRDSRY